MFLNELGLIKDHGGLTNEALSIFNRVIEHPLSDDYDRASAIHNIGNVYVDINNFEEAQKWYLRSLVAHQKLNDKRGIKIAYEDLGEVAFLKSEFQRSTDYFKSALDIVYPASKIQLNDEVFVLYEWLAKAYDSLGNAALANSYYRLHEKSIEDYKTSREVILATQEKASFQLLIQKLQRESVQKQVGKEYLWYSVIVALLISTVTIIFFIKKRKQRQRQMYEKLNDILLDD